MNQPTFILASASPRRVELLHQLLSEFEVLPSSVAEIEHAQLTAGELCQINAYRKARVVAKKHPDAIVMGVDTLVALKNRVFGKPRNRKEAQSMLLDLQGRTHQVWSGVCLISLRDHRQRTFAELTDVTFRSLTEAEVDHYLARVNPLDKAGAYAIQEHGADIVRSIKGSFSNVVGLPLETLRREFAKFERQRALAGH